MLPNFVNSFEPFLAQFDDSRNFGGKLSSRGNRSDRNQVGEILFFLSWEEEESNSINRILSFQFRHRSSEGRLVEERKNGEKSDVVTRGTRFRNGRGNDLRRRRRRRKMRVESVHSCTDSGSRTWLHPRDAVNSGQTCRGLEETDPRMSLTAHLTVAHLRSISSHLTLHPFHIYASMWPAKVSLSSSIARQQSLLWILSEGRGEGMLSDASSMERKKGKKERKEKKYHRNITSPRPLWIVEQLWIIW